MFQVQLIITDVFSQTITSGQITYFHLNLIAIVLSKFIIFSKKLRDWFGNPWEQADLLLQYFLLYVLYTTPLTQAKSVWELICISLGRYLDKYCLSTNKYLHKQTNSRSCDARSLPSLSLYRFGIWICISCILAVWCQIGH